MLPIILNFNQRNPVISNAISAIPYNGNIYTACISVKKRTQLIVSVSVPRASECLPLSLLPICL